MTPKRTEGPKTPERQTRLVLAGLVTAWIACTGSADAQAQKLNVVCSVQIEWCELVRKAYQQATGTRMTVVHRSSIEALALLIYERKNPHIDVWFGGTGDPHLQAAEQGLTAEYRSPQFENLQPWAQAQAQRGKFRTVGLYSGALGIAYNPEQLRRLGVQPPRCWSDLTRREFKQQVMMGNPTSSGTGYLILSALTQLFGEDDAFTYLKALHRNIAQYTHGGRGSIENVVRGEAAIAIGFMHDAITAQERGAKLKFTLPCEGAPAEIGSLSLVAGSAHPIEARRFYEWALRPETQTLARQVEAFQWPSNAKVAGIAKIPNPNLSEIIDYDHRKFGSSEVRKRLLRRWANEVNSPGNE